MLMLAPLALAPFGLDGVLVAFALGIAFGFTLESSGFGDARRLAAQFYLREMRVLKVMFTAIVTCMLLLLWSSALGWMDLGAVWVNPTFLGPAVVGGLLLGVGFIVGGYCPGTSLVSAATGKIDGAFFVLGVAAGGFVFGETVELFRTFYDTAGAMGRVTIPEWLGVSPGVVGLGVLLMALGMFWGAEALERVFGRPAFQDSASGSTASVSPAAMAPARRFPWRPAVRGGAVGLLVFLGLGFALPAVGQPTVDDRLERLAPDLDEALRTRSVHADPVEVLGLMHGHVQGVRGRVRLVLLDVRSESDFNLFHLVDARRTTVERLHGNEGRALGGPAHATSIVVVMSNDEAEGERAWRFLKAHGVAHAYVLAGGLNLWLEVFREEHGAARARPDGDESMRHLFMDARGERYGFAKPLLPTYQRLRRERDPEWRVKPAVAAPAASGGCG